MRALAWGLAFLGLATIPAAWSPLRLAGETGTQTGRSSLSWATQRDARRAPGAPAVAATLPLMRTDDAAIAAAPAERSGAVAAATEASSAAPKRPGPPNIAASPVNVRAYVPGSKAHAQAIAAHLASAKTMADVAPLVRLYHAYFSRTPDYEGLTYYIGERDIGETLDAIADEFAGSLEFELRYGEIDDAAFVDRVYRNVFGGPGDPAQRAYWLAELESGRMTRGRLMLEFSESAAFRGLMANPVFVTMAYAETLGRTPQPAELERWVRFLDTGNPPHALVQELLKRPRGP